MSSGSESDDDYVPEKNPVQLSEEESADDETDKQFENELEQKKQKRKAAANVSKVTDKKKRKTRATEEVIEEPEQKEIIEEESPPEEQKKREDDLWAMFLDGTDTKPKSKDTSNFSPALSSKEPPKPVINAAKESKKLDTNERDKRIFEFAGETIVVENDVIKERIKTGETPSPSTAFKKLNRSAAGSVSGLLGQLNKKNKLSTLEKSKLDWTTFKKDEGIEEEVSSHNKGKNGYLERRDFLERADYRQYEIERDMRMGRRSNR